MIGFAVLLLAAVVIMIFSMSFFVSWANYQSSLAFDSYHSQMVEMAGLQQVVQESILALRSTAPINDTNTTINGEINARLSAMSFGSGVSVTLAGASIPPAHVFFPLGPAPAISNLPMFTTTTVQPCIAGTGNRMLRFLTSGPASDLGTDPAGVAPYSYSIYSFSRKADNSTAENRTITVAARLFSVPVTNIDCIAYGLPSSGSVPPSDPAMPNGFFANGISRLVTTLNDPGKDQTFYPDLFDPNNAGSLGYQWQNNVLFSWDAYEYIWSNAYQNALLNAAGPAGTYDFQAPVNPPINGVTYDDSSVYIDLSSVTTNTLASGAPAPLAVVDAEGGNNVEIYGSAAGNSLNASPLLLYLRNTGPQPTLVTFFGDNNRPIILICRQCKLMFFGNPQFQGAIILDPNSTATGSATLYGHLSFYYAANPFPGWNLTLNDSPGVKTALAPLAPRALLISTSASR
jgi:hypothetical protein